jgi:hypothetical protein
MAPIIDRRYYDHKKRQHDGFKLVLNIIRILAIALLAYIFILALVTTLQEKPSQEYLNYVTSSNNVTKIISPIVLITWIIAKVIVVAYRNKLRELKRQVEVVDEI